MFPINDTNSLYYLFSTVAQSLAGAIALLAAFLLYRLALLGEEMGYNGGILANAISSDEARRLNGEGFYAELLRLFSTLRAGGFPVEFARLTALVQYRGRLMRRFLFSLSMTASTMIGSVACILLAPHHAQISFMIWIAWGVVAAFAICVGSYALVIWTALQFVRQHNR